MTKYPNYFLSGVLPYCGTLQVVNQQRKIEEEEEMTVKISRCTSCSECFNSKIELKGHVDKNHRITNSKIVVTTSNAAVISKNTMIDNNNTD